MACAARHPLSSLWISSPYIVSLVEGDQELGWMRNVDEIRSASFFPSGKRKWRKKGEGGAAVAATGLRDLVKWASRSKLHPRASYGSGNRSALWPR